MNTASSEPPADYAMSFVKNSPAIYMNGGGPSVSQAYPTMMHPHMQPLYGPPQPQQQPQQQQQNVTEFTNLTPLMNSGMTPQGFSQMHMGMGGGPFGPSSTTGDSSNPSSTSSSRTRLANLGDDSGLSVSSNNGSLLLPGNMGGHGGINMSYGSPQMDLAKMDDDLEPMSRDRCNTWPLRRPTLDINAQTSPLIHDRIPEEDTLYESNENVSSVEASAMAGVTSGANATDGSGSFSSNEYTPTNMNMSSPEGPSDCPMNDGSGGAASKKTTTRRNAWGNMSYADLITQAIMSSPEKRLTLSQVYEWMVQNVPYFRDKGDSNSSAGWKNSIRHNLSLHSRFMRIQNEGAGKSSWWVINPDAKPGRNPRRRAATMEGPTKAALDKKRRGVRKRAEIGSNLSVANSGSLRGPLHSAGSSAIGSTASIVSRDLYNDQDDVLNTNFDAFRSRAQSNISMPPNGSRMSPKVEAFDDFDFPPWADQQQRSSNPEMNDIMGRTDQIRLDNDFNGGSGLAINGMKTDPLPFSEISCPPPGMGAPMTPPNLIRRPQQPPQGYQMGNQQMPHQMRMDMSRGYNAYGPPPPMYGNGMMQQGNGSPMPQQNQHAQHQQQQQQQQWGNPTMDPYSALHGHPCNGGEMMSNGHMLFDQSGPLPLDLENLTLPPNNIMDLDVDSILRHEMAQDGTPLAFDL